MALSIVPELCTANDTTARIVIRSDRNAKTQGSEAYTELQSTDARRMALTYAQKYYGLSSPGVSASIEIYAADENGSEITSPGQPGKWFQADIPVTKRIV